MHNNEENGVPIIMAMVEIGRFEVGNDSAGGVMTVLSQ